MVDQKYRIALVEDDESLGYVLTEYLKMNEFNITWIKEGNMLMEKLSSKVFHLLILDITLPDSNGFEIAEMVKLKFPDLPFLFLTARSLKVDVLKGFALGAVDYLKKPIDEEELVARIHALLHRVVPPQQSTLSHQKLEIGKYTFDPHNQVLESSVELIRLTTRESAVLLFLAMRMNQLCSHKDILNGIWGKNDYFNKKSLNVFVSHLRKYLINDPAVRIENVRNRGFILSVNSNHK